MDFWDLAYLAASVVALATIGWVMWRDISDVIGSSRR